MADNKMVITLALNDNVTRGLNNVKKNLTSFSANFKANWLKITAAITASILAIQKAFDLAKIGAKFKQQELAFRNLSASVGANADQIIRDLRVMSGEALSTADIMQNASRAMALGLSPDQLPRLMEISRAAARAFGEDVGFMFDSITLGIGRQSRMILDNLGIIVSAETAYENYAQNLGKSVKELTDLERRQAFANEVMRQGGDLLAKVNVQQKTQFENLQTLSAFWEDFKVKAGNAILATVQAIGVLVNVLRTGLATVIQGLSNAFAIVVGQMASMTGKIDEIISKLPLVNSPLEGLTERLETLNLMSSTFGEGFSQQADIFAESAINIMQIMDDNVTASSVRLRKAVESVKSDLDGVKKEGQKITTSVGSSLVNVMSGIKKMSDFWKDQWQRLASSLINTVLNQIIAKLTSILVLKKAIGFFGGGIIGGLFSQGGIVSPSGTNLPLPRAAQGSLIGNRVGRAIPVIAHEGEVIGTPDRLNQAGIGGVNVTVNITEANMSSSEDRAAVAEDIGFMIESKLRTARGI